MLEEALKSKEEILEQTSRVLKKGNPEGVPLIRGLLLWQGTGGAPQIQSFPPSWPVRGSGGWSKGFFIILLNVLLMF